MPRTADAPTRAEQEAAAAVAMAKGVSASSVVSADKELSAERNNASEDEEVAEPAPVESVPEPQPKKLVMRKKPRTVAERLKMMGSSMNPRRRPMLLARKIRRLRPGTKAAREVKNERKKSSRGEWALPKSVVERLVREVASEFKSDMRFTKKAIELANEAVDSTFSELMDHANMFRMMRKGKGQTAAKTLQPQDLFAAMFATIPRDVVVKYLQSQHGRQDGPAVFAYEEGKLGPKKRRPVKA